MVLYSWWIHRGHCMIKRALLNLPLKIQIFLWYYLIHFYLPPTSSFLN
jgi:hypothetical protein